MNFFMFSYCSIIEVSETTVEEKTMVVLKYESDCQGL